MFGFCILEGLAVPGLVHSRYFFFIKIKNHRRFCIILFVIPFLLIVSKHKCYFQNSVFRRGKKKELRSYVKTPRIIKLIQ